MKRSLLTIIFLIALLNSNFAQHPAVSQPGYNPTVPRLISMRHEATSQIENLDKVSIEDFNNKTSLETINVYFVYEKDSTVGKSNGDSELFNPPAKLMDLYVIYNYNYRFHLESTSSFGEFLPKIKLTPTSFLKEATLTLYSTKKGKLKSTKIKKKEITAEVVSKELAISVSENLVPSNSYVELDIKIKSRYFTELTPIISNSRFDNKTLTINLPKLFSYDIKNINSAKTNSGEFELLHFVRDSGAGNGNIKVFDIGFDSYSWNDSTINEGMTKIPLNRVNFPVGSDIGIPPNELIVTTE